MTVNKTFTEFANALDLAIESAMSCASDAAAFLRANKAIETLLEEEWPAVATMLQNDGIDPENADRLRQIVEVIAQLEAKTQARLVWGTHFDDYMKKALSKDGKA
jgi:hypothetical protein